MHAPKPRSAKSPYPERRLGFWLDLKPGPARGGRLNHLPNLGLFAVFDDLPVAYSDASRLFVARSPRELGNQLRRLIASRAIRNCRVYVETAASESDFTDLQYEKLVWTVLASVQRIKARGDTATLRRLRAAIERKGIKPGPKAQEYARKWKVETLKNLAHGIPFEAAVTHPARKRALESARQEIWMYCREFYLWCLLTNLHRLEEWQKPKAAEHFLKEFGVAFPADLDAAKEAYARGRRTVDKHLAAYDCFLASSQPRSLR
jgi:hypothetical protein